jgi:hypothetical protein
MRCLLWGVLWLCVGALVWTALIMLALRIANH